ncbi:glycerol-3-phosphate responsive antiterminator [Paenibacillus tyrfis]|uniref:glycerol-3-phosphate responsive antiterminator n=2 Tax=Paenibacillus TaxID=44249 RepID=UPI00209DE6BF|nr:glycerol-3-phosphate responsive antiterminator [Paenibacillus tyrfis]MCP1310532.1 glycerol-3-phosphate responsive antiterminator [Paenibacillus tyrfis]
MQDLDFLERLRQSRMIASVKEHKTLEKAAKAKVGAVVLSIGNIGNIKSFVDLYKKNRIPVFLHVERLGGLSQDSEGMSFLATCVKPDGIVTTRNQLIKLAKKEGLLTIQRIFLFDSDSVKSGLKSVQETQPNAIEIMPALLPEYIRVYRQETNIPIIAGGLIQTREQIKEALQSGAVAVSMGTHQLWREPIGEVLPNGGPGEEESR